jgi:hypothetical protein
MRIDPAKLRAVRLSLRDGATRYLDHFVQVLCRLDGEVGFGAGDVAAVESVWGSCGEERWVGGFVVALKDGRRAYLEACAGEPPWSDDDADLRVEFLRPGEPYPRLGADHRQQLLGWDDGAAEELDPFLKRLTAYCARRSPEST